MIISSHLSVERILISTMTSIYYEGKAVAISLLFEEAGQSLS